MKKPRVLSVVGWLLVAAVVAFVLFRYINARNYEDWLEEQALAVVEQVQAIPAEELEYVARYAPWQLPSQAIVTPGWEQKLGDREYIIQTPDEELDAAVRKLVETMTLSSFESRETPPDSGEALLNIIFFGGQDGGITFYLRSNIRLEYRGKMEDGNLLYAQYAVDRDALLTLWDALGVPRKTATSIE